MENDAYSLLMNSFVLGYWGGFGIVLLLMLESLPVIGLFMPGVVLMVALGTLSGTLHLSFADCVLYSIIGALLGDSIGYWLGYLGIGHRFLQLHSKRSRNSHAMAEQLLKRYGRLVVFVGRFVWFFHPAVPFIAGVGRIRPGWFYLADIPAVIIWVIVYAGIGHWASGMARERGMEFMLILGVLFVLFGLMLLLRYIRKKQSKNIK